MIAGIELMGSEGVIPFRTHGRWRGGSVHQLGGEECGKGLVDLFSFWEGRKLS